MMTINEAVARELAEIAGDTYADGRAYWLACADQIIRLLRRRGALASAGEAGTAETVKLGSVHEHAVGDSRDAQEQSA